MKKSYIVLALAVVVATASCRRSEQELPDRQNARPKISTKTIGFAETSAIQVGDAEPTPQIQYTPGIPAASLPTGGDDPSGTPVGVITPLGTVDTAAISRLTNNPIGRQTAPHSTESFRAGDMIGVFVHSTADVAEGEANHTVNTPYIIADGTTWSPVYALGGAFTEPEYYMSAYYPYSDAVTNALQMPHSVALDQSAPLAAVSGALEKSNFLIARGAAIANATTNAEASLTFVHTMSLFEVKIHLPQMVEGRELDSLETIIVKGTETRATINLATGGISVVAGNIADIKPRRVSGTGRPGVMSVFEAIVVPQNITEGVTLLEIRCRMKDHTIESFDYTIPKLNWMAFKSGYRTSITLMPTAEASFMGELPQLIDGLAHNDMELPIFVAKDLRWELSVENIDWMTISDAAGGTYGKTLSGNSLTGAITNIYVKVDANMSQFVPRQGEMILRAYRTDGSEVAPAVYLAVQNYYNFAGSGSTWNATAASGSTPVAPFSGNQTWKAVSADSWVKLAASATYGQGNPVTTYSHVGALQAGQLFLQADANNSAGARQTTVSFASDNVGGTSFVYTVKQAAPDITLSSSDIGAGAAATADADLMTVTAPVGVKWQILSASGAIGGFTTTPAVGTEMTGTGAAQTIKVSYDANATTSAQVQNLVIAYAAMGASQQKPVKVTQSVSNVKIGGLLWASGNLVADGANGARIGAPGDGGLYFNFGSLIGWKGGASGNGTGRPAKADNTYYGGASFNAVNEVQVVPTPFTTIANIGTTWPNQTTNLYYFGLQTPPYATAGTNIQDYSGFLAGSLASSGVGDPCRYYLGDTWRMPTSIEAQAMHDAATTKTYPGSWVRGTSTTSYLIFTFTGGAELRFPAVGYRHSSDGAIYNVGDYGYYWSSSVFDSTSGYGLRFGSGNVNPQGNYGRRNGFPVRCVQDVPTEPQTPTASDYITIDGLKWTKGNLVAVGSQNAKVGAPTDGGLYFQFGSLIGWKGGAAGDGTGRAARANGTFYSGASFNASSEVQVVPTPFTAIANIGTTWPNQPGTNLYYFGYDTAPYATTGTNIHDYSGFLAGSLASSGVGDPCRYYLGDSWRMPTNSEIKAMHDAATTKTYLGSWTSGTSTTSYMVFTFLGGTELRFPAVGLRANSSGSISNVGDNGWYWSSSVTTSINGYVLSFLNGSVNPQNSSNRRYGFPARCVEGVTIETNPKAWTGVSSAGASLDVVVSVGGASGWTAQPSATAGFTASPTSGNSGDKITLTWSSNTTPGSPARSASVVFTANGSAKTYTLNTSQNAAGPEFVTINGLKWTTGNLVADGANGCKVGVPGDGGLYFQFGSLIGWKGGASGNGTGRAARADGTFYSGASFNASSEVQVVPTPFTTIANIGTTWPNQTTNLYYFGYITSPYATVGTNIQNYAGFLAGSLASSGVGDPCRYYLGDAWRLPTYIETKAMSDAAASKTWPGSWTSGTSTDSYFVCTFSGGAELRFPAVGYRNSGNGAIYSVGDNGYYWSSSVYDSTSGYTLNFNSGYVYPQGSNSRRNGFPVRCVSN